MARVMSATVSAYFETRHEVAGCNIHRTRSVSAIETEIGWLQCVTLDDGRKVAADLVVVGIGVVPNVDTDRTVRPSAAAPHRGPGCRGRGQWGRSAGLACRPADGASCP